MTPLAESLSDLDSAREEIEKAGLNEAATISEIARRIRAKAATLPRGAMEPLTDQQIEAMVDAAVQQTLGKQRKKVSTLVAHRLKMSSTRAVVRLLADDQAKSDRAAQTSQKVATELSNRCGGRPYAAHCSVSLSNAPSLLTLGAKSFPTGFVSPADFHERIFQDE